ncbi:MAG: hypothetical protein J4473_04290 [Candidatus Aenigmarchaeota archaeon]|nr:hypothetical protein [Candidatus Aenigmarchaeota archaeon]
MKFERQDVFRHKRLKSKWRYPTGNQSKLRKSKAGNIKKPSIGFGSRRNGENVFYVSHEKQIQNIIPGSNIIINAKLGKKKYLDLVEKLKGFKILNKRKLKKRAVKIQKEEVKEMAQSEKTKKGYQKEADKENKS